MLTVDYLKTKFQVKEDQELASLLGKTAGAISKWRAAGEIPALAERRALELLAERGIVCEKETPYDGETIKIPPGISGDDVRRFMELPKTTQAMMARVMEEMYHLTEAEQWKAAGELLAKVQKKEGE